MDWPVLSIDICSVQECAIGTLCYRGRKVAHMQFLIGDDMRKTIIRLRKLGIPVEFTCGSRNSEKVKKGR